MMFEEEFISENNGKFSIDRVFNDVKYNFGIFDSYDDALDYLDYLEEEGWPLDVNIQSEELLPNNIEEIDGKFSVFKYIMGEKITFGEFDTLDEAKTIKNNLISNAWESLEYNDRGEYGKYIRKSGDKFLVSRTYNGETYNFGYFNTLDDAMEVREHLVETNWGDLNIEHKMRYGKYIGFNGMYYSIQKVIDGELIVFGLFKKLEDAKKQRDLLIQDNWSRFDVPDDSTKYIRKDGDKYIIFNYINDEFQFFGESSSLEEAKKIRNELIVNEWIIPEDERTIEEICENIFFDGEFYSVEKEFGDEIRIYGVFKNKNRAIECKNDLIDINWDRNFAIKTKQYPFGENIIPFDYIFIVEFFEDGEKIELGNYMSFDEALIARNEYLNQKINVDKLIFSVKVGKSYKNRGWSIIRDSTYELIPKLEYEDDCDIIVDGIPAKAKLNLLPRIFYDSSNGELVEHLKDLNEINPDKRVNVEFLLNKETNDNISNLKNIISELNNIIETQDNKIFLLNNEIKNLKNEISKLSNVVEGKNKEISDLKDLLFDLK